MYGAGEIKLELAAIFDEVLNNNSKDHRSLYYDLIEMLLTKIFVNIEIVKALPEYVLKLGGLFWFRSNEQRDRIHSSLGVEEDFCIDEQIGNYFPASAYQTPIYWLLKTKFAQTINFILDFTNKAVECFLNRSWDKMKLKQRSFMLKIKVTNNISVIGYGISIEEHKVHHMFWNQFIWLWKRCFLRLQKY